MTNQSIIAQLLSVFQFFISFFCPIPINANNFYLLRLCWNYLGAVFTARCNLVQSAVLRSHVVCLSVCLF